MLFKKIILFACDPGGANTVFPLLDQLKLNGFNVVLYGINSALKKYDDWGYQGIDFSGFVQDCNIQNVIKFLLVEKPDAVITGTSANNFTEKYLWLACKILNIPSFAILDQWVNYGIRFSPFAISEINEYCANKIHTFLPSKIFVMDDFAKNEMVHDGINPAIIEVTGQPYFEMLLKHQSTTKVKARCTDEFVLTFVSEPITETYQECEAYWGYTEKTIFKKLLNSLVKVNSSYNKKISLIIKIHPRENLNKYLEEISHFDDHNIKISIDAKTMPIDLIHKSDLICGMCSMMLIEAVILQKPILSIQIGLQKKNPFILSSRGIIKNIDSEEELAVQIMNIFSGRTKSYCDFDFIKNPVSCVIDHIERFLC